MAPFKKLSSLAWSLIELEAIAIKNNDLKAAHIYSMAWFDVDELMYADIMNNKHNT